MTMYAIIEDDNGNELARFELLDSDVMSAEDFAQSYIGSDNEVELIDGPADYYVVFTDDPDNKAKVWSRHGFYVKCDYWVLTLR